MVKKNAFLSFAIICFGLLVVNMSSAEAGHQKILIFKSMEVPVVADTAAYITSMFPKKIKHDIEIDVISAEGNVETGKARFNASLSEKKYDLIITIASLASKIAKEILDRQNNKPPQLFVVVADPISAGLVKENNAITNDRRTGIIYGSTPNSRLRTAIMLLETNAKFKSRPVNVAILRTDYISAKGDAKSINSIRQDRIIFHDIEVPYKPLPEYESAVLENLDQKIKSSAQQYDFFWEVAGPIAELTNSTNLIEDIIHVPALYGNKETSVKAGALFSKQVDTMKQAEEVVLLALRIIGGKNAGEIPVKYSKSIRVSLNASTAKNAGILFPIELLKLAEGRIYR